MMSFLFDFIALSLFFLPAFEKNLVYKGQEYLIQVVDTAGQVRRFCNDYLLLISHMKLFDLSLYSG